MQYRNLGNTGLRVSAIGLGCAGLRPGNVDVATQIVHRALELGVNYFDVARVYGDAEIKLGLALEGRRGEAIISTKTMARTRDDAWRDIESSLERLRVSYIDNFHLHNITSAENLNQRLGKGGALEALVEAREQGLIGHIGCTGHRNDLLVEALHRFPFETVLFIMNIFAREPLAELIPLCEARGVGITVMKGLGKGWLPPVLALKWLLNQPVHCVVPGAASLAELEQSAGVGNGDIALSAAETVQAAELVATLGPRYCSVCARCEPCPVGITISDILGTDGRLYTYRAHGEATFRAFPWSREDILASLPTREASIAAIERCTRCGVCEERCPRSLPVMALLQEVLPPLGGIVGIFHEVLGE